MNKSILKENLQDARQNSSGSFRSWGKLLLTGEYLIMKGAEGLALPVKPGQELSWRSTGQGSFLEWVTRVKGEEWFNAVFRGDAYNIVSSSDRERAEFLRKILVSAAEISANPPVYGKAVSSVDFDMEWGLGSSSSLISNVAFMFGVNPFILHFKVSKGSGYDVACARSSSPVLYRLNYKTDIYKSAYGSPHNPECFPIPVYREVDFNPHFKNKLFFAWSGRKQNSATSVERFNDKSTIKDGDILKISGISREILNTSDTGSFIRLLREHDEIISRILGEEPLSLSRFRGFPGYVKALGAWGGDFILIVWEGDVDELMQLLKQKGIEVVFPYDKLIRSSNGK
ncbi:MAG: GYDIA family GHMP kinase [Bacteroidales bacterium]